jgi:hypothetical protein
MLNPGPCRPWREASNIEVWIQPRFEKENNAGADFT